MQSDYDNLRRGASEYQYKFTQVNQDFQSKINNYELRIKQINQENDEMKRRLLEFGDISRKIGQY